MIGGLAFIMKKRRNNDLKNVVLAIIFLMVVFMTVGYAAYSRDLIINGFGKIHSDWDVHFTDISEPYITGGALEVLEPVIASDGLSLTMDIALTKPGDEISYLIDITNFSEMFDAVYMGATFSTNETTNFILYEIFNIDVGDRILADTSNGFLPNHRTVTVRAFWNPARTTEVPDGVTSDLDTTYEEIVTITLHFEAGTP